MASQSRMRMLPVKGIFVTSMVFKKRLDDLLGEEMQGWSRLKHVVSLLMKWEFVPRHLLVLLELWLPGAQPVYHFGKEQFHIVWRKSCRNLCSTSPPQEEREDLVYHEAFSFNIILSSRNCM